MKILFLNPQVDSEHKLASELRAKGYAVLVPESVLEAWQMLCLHGSSVNLAIIHRENDSGKGEEGLDLVKKIRADSQHQDLPYILTSSVWGSSDFSKHQASALGANAYLKWPFSGSDLVTIIEQVLGDDIKPNQSEPNTSLSMQLTGIQEIPKLGMPTEAPEISIPTAKMPTAAERFAASLQIGSENSELEPFEQLDQSERVEMNEAEVESDVATELPYLFNKGRKQSSAQPSPTVSEFAMMQPLGDAVVPGGAFHTPDAETFKKYLLLREQDVAVLSAQVRDLKTQLARSEELLKQEKSTVSQYEYVMEDQKKRLEEFEKNRRLSEEGILAELNEMKFQMKAKNDRVRALESQIRDATEEVVRIKERVKLDLRKIRTREKELENRLEVLKRDSEALLNLRESKIVELKRKIDLLEFNLDVAQDQHNKEKDHSAKLKEQLGKAAQAVRLAGGLLDSKEVLAAVDSDHDKQRSAS